MEILDQNLKHMDNLVMFDKNYFHNQYFPKNMTFDYFFLFCIHMIFVLVYICPDIYFHMHILLDK